MLIINKNVRDYMKKKILIVLIVIVIFIFVGFSIWYFKYIYKYNQIAKFINENNQDIYILGTYHGEHFNRFLNYSMQDIAMCIKNINPDIVLIESREETYRDYNVIDGPIDMILAYSYCKQENISIDMIDYWEVNDNTMPGTTDEKRDDIINKNIIKKLDNNLDKKRVLIICGDTHFREQIKRFKNQKFKEEKIKNRKELFYGEEDFKYPLIMQDIIENKIDYVSNILKNDIDNKIKNNKNKEEWQENCNFLIQNLKRQLELVKDNKLYY